MYSNSNKAIAYVLGTKAMFIKTQHIIKYLKEENIEVLILDTGQHKEITRKEIEKLEGNYQIINITKSDANISSIYGMIKWFFGFIVSPKKNELFDDIKYCIIHGDTISTLMGLIYAKKNNLKIIHVEAGYKSNSYLRPFPEEIFRSLVSRYADILVVDGEKQQSNVEKYKSKKEIIRISRNTVIDALVSEIQHIEKKEVNQLTITIHRTENIYNKKNFDSLIQLINNILKEKTYDSIKWFCHDVTASALRKRNIEKSLEISGVQLLPLLPYGDFINEIYNSRAIITDGGSIAEECSILGIKTLVWRDVIEQENIIGENLKLSNYDIKESLEFLTSEKINQKLKKEFSKPSKELVDSLLKII